MRKVYLPVLAVALLALAGCDKDSASVESREENDPLVLSGQQLMEQGNYDEAIGAFEQAIANEPSMARPHLDLAMSYQQLIVSYQQRGIGIKQHVDNHVNAIYHYGRYLQLRPGAEKAEFIDQQRQKVVEALAAFLINTSPDVKRVVQERNQMVQENNDLKRRLAAALKDQPPVAAKPATQSSVTTTVPKSVKNVEPSATKTETSPAAKHQIYHVVGGDTLSRIANKFYGDSGKWDVIFNANKDTLRDPGDLKVGQTIVIPSIGN